MKTKVLILMVICIFVGFVLGVYFGSPLRHYFSSFTEKNKPVSESQTAKEAIKALKKLEAKTQVGISYQDYAPALGDALFEVKTFLESPDAAKMPQLSESLKKVMECYSYAKGFYDIWVEVKCLEIKNPEFRKSTVEWVKQVMITYPELSEAIWKREGDRCNPGRMSMEMAISILWRKGSGELERATNLLSQSSK
jgi:uncharacterized protein YneF (UPF0154 family)